MMTPSADKDYAPEDGEEPDFAEDLEHSIERQALIARELSWLFGEDIFEQASHIDIAEINMSQEITSSIATGIKQLKELKNDPVAQKDLVESMEAGTRILLCLWILDMELLDRIQGRSYLA